MESVTLPDYQTFDEAESDVAEARFERDRYSWFIGAWACRYCVERPVGGRPGPDDYTTAKLAGRIGELPHVVGEWRNNYFFWQSLFERIPDNASWRNCADSRRRCGWRPGKPITEEHEEHAIKFLLEKTDWIPERDARPLWAREIERAA